MRLTHSTHQVKPGMMRSIVLTVDIGSTRIRCSAYEYHGGPHHPNHYHWKQSPLAGPIDVDAIMMGWGNDSAPKLVNEFNGVSRTIPISAVSDTGNIRIHEVLGGIDICIDETLKLLNQHHTSAGSCYQVVAIGFTTFVMNLVGVDIHGDPVGEAATCSFACNREDVVKECERLRDYLGQDKLHALHQRTGSPIHSSHALPQLLAFYRDEKYNSLAKQVEKWETISSICLYRWSGRPNVQMPMSFSEASWTGMLDFRTGCWDDVAVHIVESCDGAVCAHAMEEDDDEVYPDVIDLFPPTADFDAPLPFLRAGIPQLNDDGRVNSYWERWPELRSYPVNLFFGIGNLNDSKCSAGPEWVRVHHSISHSNNEDECDITIPPGLLCKRVHRDQIIVVGCRSDGGSLVDWAQSLTTIQTVEAYVSCSAPVQENLRLSGTKILFSSVERPDFLGVEGVTVMVAASLQQALLRNSYQSVMMTEQFSIGGLV